MKILTGSFNQNGRLIHLDGNLSLMLNQRILSIVLVLGPRVCGATTIHRLLAGIEGVAIPWPVIEAHIFDRGPLGIERIRLFAGKILSVDSLIFVDVATHYFSDRKHWQAIKDRTFGFILRRAIHFKGEKSIYKIEHKPNSSFFGRLYKRIFFLHRHGRWLR